MAADQHRPAAGTDASLQTEADRGRTGRSTRGRCGYSLSRHGACRFALIFPGSRPLSGTGPARSRRVLPGDMVCQDGGWPSGGQGGATLLTAQATG
jgi:hypothetical protein